MPSSRASRGEQRFVTRERICHYLGDISGKVYDEWQRRGLVPGPVPGTDRYDLHQHDDVLDRRLGLIHGAKGLSPVEEWERLNGKAS